MIFSHIMWFKPIMSPKRNTLIWLSYKEHGSYKIKALLVCKNYIWDSQKS